MAYKGGFGKGQNVTLDGHKELLDALERMMDAATGPRVSDEIHKTAEFVRRRMRDKIHDETGNLSRSLTVQRLKKTAGGLSTILWPSWKIAKHAHIVEYGVPHDRFNIKGGIPQLMGNSVFGSGEFSWVMEGVNVSLGFGPVYKVGPMPARPFFRKTVDDNNSVATDKIAEGSWKVLKRAFDIK